MSQPKDHKKTAPVSIRVIETGKAYADLDDLSPEELDARLDSIRLGFGRYPEDPVGKSGAGWFGTMVRERKRLIQASPDGGHALGKAADAPLPKTMAEVAARELIRASGVLAVVAARKAPPEAIRVRPDRVVRALELRRGKLAPVSLATEQPVQLLGFRLSPGTQAQAILDVHGGWSDPRVPSALSVAAARTKGGRLGPALSSPGQARARPYISYSAAAVASLRRAAGWATAAHLTGARKAVGMAVAAPLPRRPPASALGDATVARAPPLPPVSPSVLRLAAQLAEVSGEGGGRPSPYAEAVLGDVFRAGAGGTLYFAETEGPGSETVRQLLDRARMRAANAKARAELRRRVDANAAKALRYLGIVEDKFGEPRMKAAEAAGGTANPGLVLKALTAREREIVELEYKSQEKAFEASLNNKCPHVGLVDRLRAATNTRAVARLLRELEPYYKDAPPPPGGRKPGGRKPGGRKPGGPEAPGKWIECRSCGFRVVCPHVDELLRLQVRGAPFAEIASALTKYAMRHGTTGGFHKYFCRICGELTGEVAPAEADRRRRGAGAVGNLNSYLRRAVWGEALRAVDQVVFPAPVDPRLFARTAADRVYPLLVEAEKTFSRATRTQIQVESMEEGGAEEDISPIMRLYVSLYVYAYIFNLIRSSRASKVPKKSRVGFEGAPPDARLSRVAEQILRTIQKRKSGVLSRLEDVTPEMIASRFRQAYLAIHGNCGDQELAGVHTTMDAANSLISLSPVYYYAAVAARVYGKVPPGRALGPKAARQEYEAVMGASFPKALNARAAIKGSKLAQLLLGVRFTGAGERRVPPEFPPGADPLYVYNAPQINLFQKILRPPKRVDTKAFDLLVKVAGPRAGSRPEWPDAPVPAGAPMPGGFEPGVVGGRARAPGKVQPLRQMPGYSSDGLFHECYRTFVRYTTGVTDASAMDAYSKELEAVRTREDGFLIMRGVAATRPFRSAATPPFKPPPKPVSVAQLYGEDGHEHTWVGHNSKKTVYVYSNGAEFTVKQLAEATAKMAAEGKPAGPLAGLHLTGEKCGVCGVLQSETGKLDLAKVSEALTESSERLSFFVFYETRCPKGDLHEFGEDAVCKKCGLRSGLSFQDDKKAAGAYYKRYVGTFRKQKAEARELGARGAAPAAPSPSRRAPETQPAAPKKWRGFAEGWKPDYGVVVRAAELAGRPVAAMETIGATEGRLYPDVLAGKDAPPPPAERSDPRLAAADAAVRLFVQRWNRLRNVARLGRGPAPHQLAALLDAVPPHEHENLPAVLPDVADGYAEKRAAMLEARPPADVLLFSIEQLGRAALRAASVKSPKWAHDLSRRYSKALLDIILRGESLLSKNGPFDFGVFGADEDVPDDDGDPEAADHDEGGADHDEGSGFSLEGSDIRAGHPNLE